jgi:hypothetical protein
MQNRRLFVFLGLMTAMPTAASASSPALAPHRAVYDLTLSKSTGANGLEGASGRIVMEITGSVCDGYAQNVRQVVDLDTGGGRVRLDHRVTTYESGEGTQLRFRKDLRKSDQPDEAVQGSAERRDGAILVETAVPKKERHRLADGVFPARHQIMLIEAARAGAGRLEAKLFDGADRPDKLSDAIAVIGQRAKSGAEALDEPSRAAGLADMPRWPVSLSFFEAGSGDQEPSHTVSFEMFDNGIARRLTLDFGDFVMKGELKSLEMLKAPSCSR